MANIFTRGFGIRRSNLALHVKVLIRGQLCLYDPEHWAVLSLSNTHTDAVCAAVAQSSISS